MRKQAGNPAPTDPECVAEVTIDKPGVGKTWKVNTANKICAHGYGLIFGEKPIEVRAKVYLDLEGVDLTNPPADAATGMPVAGSGYDWIIPSNVTVVTHSQPEGTRNYLVVWIRRNGCVHFNCNSLHFKAKTDSTTHCGVSHRRTENGEVTDGKR